MSSSQINPSDVDVALSDLAAGTPSHAPRQSGAAANGGNRSRPASSDRLMGSPSEDPTPTPPDPQGAPPQPPASPGPQDAPQPPPSPAPQGAPQNIVGPEAATQADISDLAQRNGQPIYWAGDQPNTSDLELTQTADGNVYVRYLTGNAPIKTPKPAYLTVGTYPFQNSLHAIDVISKEPGAKTYDVPNGGTAVQNTSSPTSVYVAFPDEKGYEIEVYDPDPAKALDLVKSGDIQPVP